MVIKSLVLGVLCILMGSLQLVTAMPVLIDDMRSNPISKSKKDPFYLYLSYGDPASKKSYEQAFITVQITGTGLGFLSNNLFEIVKNENSTPSCSESLNEITRTISYDLVQNNILQYGPSSATSETQPTGLKTNQLKPKQIGCLKLGFKVMPGATAQEEITVTIKENFLDASEGVVQIQEIPTKTILFKIGDLPVCAAGEQALGTNCVTPCSEKEYRNTLGICTLKIQQCEGDAELVGETCFPKCSSNEARNSFGECKKTTSDYSILTSTIASTVLLIVGGIILIIIIGGIYRTLSKKI